MRPDQHAEVMQLAGDAGVPAEFFAGWVEGEELSIHRRAEKPGSSSRLEESGGPSAWILDLGGRSHPLTSRQAEALKSKLTAAGIAYASFPLSHDYLQRKGEE